MCFIVFSYLQHPWYRLVLASNRDEFYARPTAPATFWEETPQVLAGRDLQGGGTWLGAARNGRWAALTNVREPGKHNSEAPTRGTLVTKFLTGPQGPAAYLGTVRADAQRYNGFNLLAGDLQHLYYYGNRTSGVRRLEPGLYGLSNDLLDTPWPKIQRGKAALSEALSSASIDMEMLFSFLASTDNAPDDDLPHTGVSLEWERLLSSIFIESPTYGTRVSTVILIDHHGHFTFAERAYAPGTSTPPVTRQYDFVAHSKAQLST